MLHGGISTCVCVIQMVVCPLKRPRRQAHPRQAVRNAPSVVWANNPANGIVVFAAVLGSRNAELPATPSLSTLGSRASRPAKVSRLRFEAYNVHALRELSVINITAFAYVVTASRTACFPRIHSSEQSPDHSWFKQSCAPVSHIHRHCRYVYFVCMPICVLT